IAKDRLEVERFHEFCHAHLGHLDEVAHDFFGDEVARSAVHQKVAALYPEHEVEEFTDLFFERIQRAREAEPPNSVSILAS
ncbi:MAG: hypothetical protein MJB57_02215, partial [Gemmatimonadetes bacterium]|nr:hypothetical protein [Gemmatimonadota bacterium]